MLYIMEWQEVNLIKKVSLYTGLIREKPFMMMIKTLISSYVMRLAPDSVSWAASRISGLL